MSTKEKVKNSARRYIGSALSELALLPGPLPEETIQQLLNDLHIRVNNDRSQARLTASTDEVLEVLKASDLKSSPKEQKEIRYLFYHWTATDLDSLDRCLPIPELQSRQRKVTAQSRQGIPKEQPWSPGEQDLARITERIGRVPTRARAESLPRLATRVFRALDAPPQNATQNGMQAQSRKAFETFQKSWSSLLRLVAGHVTANQLEQELERSLPDPTPSSSRVGPTDGQDGASNGGTPHSPSPANTPSVPPEVLALWAQRETPDLDADYEPEF